VFCSSEKGMLIKSPLKKAITIVLIMKTFIMASSEIL
jgi:hypothetical protein